MNKSVIRAGLETLYYSGVHRLAGQLMAGVGVILTFHRVRPGRPDAFQPNRLLEITPEFLDEALTTLADHDIEVIPIDQLANRLAAPRAGRFAVLTFDDGYRDNRDFALPILKRHGAPFTLFVPSAFADGAGEMWWLAVEQAIAENARIEVTLAGEARVFDCATAAAKAEAFEEINGYLSGRAGAAEFVAATRDLAERYGVDLHGQCREACMGWDEIAAFADEPLVTIGSHTVHHSILSKLSDDGVRAEIAGGIAAIETHLHQRPTHFSYPVGGPGAAATREFAIAAELGVETAVTTRPGVLFPEHTDHLRALPRISVNGEFQERRYLDVLLSGTATALMNCFRRVAAA